MQEKGWIKLHRKIIENEIWHDVTTFRLFLLLLLKAAHKDGIKINGIELKRGQYLRSYSKLADDLEFKEKRGLKKVSKSTILRSVKKLIEEGMIIVNETDYGTLFTIVKYEEYQGFDDDTETFNETVNEPLSKRNRNVIETLSKQEQELKNVKNEKNISTTTKTGQNLIQMFESNLCRLSPIQMEKLHHWINDFNDNEEIIAEAIKIADDRNKRSFGFVEYLLTEWANNKLITIEQVRSHERNKFQTKTKPYGKTSGLKRPRVEQVPSWFKEDQFRVDIRSNDDEEVFDFEEERRKMEARLKAKYS